ncbi:MAG TPA: universal stress protein, partial [Opitutaceae bacterium]|nr:universal stress protein [Opitutaceae bacterium]
AYDISAEFRVIWNDQGQEDVVLHSLHCDLIVIGHPKSHGIPENWTPDRLLRATGVPVLIVPDGKDAAGIGDKVLVAWNASREARRAITDAMPFIETAKTVTVLVIDADKGAHHYGEEPGADIALHLARHGAHVEVEQVSSHGKPIGEVILSYAAKCEADVIVIGARSHARPTEILFGGVTRTLLAQSTIPLVMSR